MNPLRNTPHEVTEKLASWGGFNPYREPNWRLLLAQNHLVQRAGVWTEFEPDVEQTSFEHVRAEEGSLMKYEQRQIAPDAVKVGVFWVPLYPCEGWILERWFGPAAIGSKAAWESALSQDGETPMMGPYPDRGMYWMPSGGGPWDEIPPLESIREAICAWENSDEHSHGEMDEERIGRAVQQAENAANEREERINEQFLRETEYAVKNNLSFIKDNPALSGFRNKIAAREGLNSHI
jgi:hypothetical protein